MKLCQKHEPEPETRDVFRLNTYSLYTRCRSIEVVMTRPNYIKMRCFGPEMELSFLYQYGLFIQWP